MSQTKKKNAKLRRRQRRVRAKISGTPTIPRLRVSRSNAHIEAQLIDDTNGVTLVSASSKEPAVIAKRSATSNKDAAKTVGEAVGTRAVEAGITDVVFDRGGRIYHGRVKALADGARSAGLKF